MNEWIRERALEACGRNCNALPVPFAKTGFFAVFWEGPKRVPKKVSKKGLKMDPQRTLNGSQNGSKWSQKGGSENDRKLGFFLEGKRWDSAAIYYTLEGSGLSEKGRFGDLFLVPFWEPKWPKRSPEWHLKNSSENRSILDSFWDPFWSHFGSPEGKIRNTDSSEV